MGPRYAGRALPLLLLSLLVTGCSERGSTRYLPAPSTASAAAPVSSSTTATVTTIQQVPISSGTFSTLTYNVAGLPQGLSSSNPIVNTPQISPLLNTYDLVLVQEDFTYHTLLAQNATHAFHSLPLTQITTFVNDGLNRFSQFPFSDFERRKWSACNGWIGNSNDCLSSKGFSAARHQIAPGIVIDVYNLHADAGGDSGDQNARTIQFAQLATFMSAYSTDNPVLVMGDTNLKTRLSVDKTVLDDFKGTLGLVDVGESLGMPDHIDRFFIRDGTDVLLVPKLWRVADEFIDANGGDLSDHPAINVDFEWRRR